MDPSVHASDASVLSALLLDVEGSGEALGDVYANVVTIDNEKYIAVQNTGAGEAYFALPTGAEEKSVTLLSGERREGSLLSFTLKGAAPSGSEAALLITDGAGFPVYADQKTVGSGGYSFEGAFADFSGGSYTVYIRTENGLSEEELFPGGQNAVHVAPLGNISLQEDFIRFYLAPKELLFLHLGDPNAPGLYDGNIRLRTLRDGTFTLRGATLAALYEESGAEEELLKLFTGETITISGTEGKTWAFKAFSWDPMLSPSGKTYVLR